MKNFVAKRSAPNTPTWDLYYDDTLVGFMSSFPGEGPMATVRLYQGSVDATSVEATTLHKCLWLARAAYEDLRYENEAQEEHIEDEDGEIAAMRHAENKAEEWAMRDDMQEPVW